MPPGSTSETETGTLFEAEEVHRGLRESPRQVQQQSPTDRHCLEDTLKALTWEHKGEGRVWAWLSVTFKGNIYVSNWTDTKKGGKWGSGGSGGSDPQRSQD